ncbi:MAG TPA: DNA polymerase III subunit alpha [Bacteroidales bacterium]|nr:MAG: DNA polymerase III subunit alpha [Bacteroidetes bacterium GWE2_42_42]HBG69241.1 DNA polymerase III subunit alpha [Bacteroidales bacterium]HCB61203.1 DNA polymerase III subunit alpha [Bacteroidales bacterium]HCY24123.1 DNA polymerase III subunit alpha [Bacteroidales bacterium]
MSQFVHLHLHTIYSVLDGAANIKKLLKRAAALNMNSVAVTDHGQMFGILEFVTEAKKAGIKPIIGCETYVARNSMDQTTAKEDRSGHHLILLAKNMQGYRNLVKLISQANLKGFFYTPRIDKDLLSKYHEGLIACSACLGGEIPQLIMNRSEEEALKSIEWYKSLFGDDYYLEMMDHGLPEQKQVNEVLVRLSQKSGVKLIATNDVHYVNKEDFEAHKILIRINTNKDDNDDLYYTGNEYLKSYDEMLALFGDHPEALANTVEISDKVEEFSIEHDVMLPAYPTPKEFSSDFEYMAHLALEGVKGRYADFNDEIKDRLDFELATIEKMGFAGYFLIVQDYIRKAREMGVLVGPGRGSAAGSIVAYGLGITNIDPIKYNLLFERFLNPDRISMPDIDVDFDDYGRDSVIDYVINQYGADKVSQIITFGKLGAKSSIRDVARVMGVELSLSNRIAKLIPDGPKVTLDDAMRNKDFEDLYNSNQDVKKVVDIARTLDGNVRSTGVHACGVIIGREDLSNYVPMARAKDSILPLVQYDGSLVEKAGLLKMDFLGLKTLSIIKDALELIEARHKKKIDIDNISLEEEKTYKLYQKGETIGTFQFESEGMRSWLKKLKPTHIEDLIAMNALFRPGPMGFIPNFIARKHGAEKVEYPHSLAETVLQDTYGIMIYQEQIMLLSQRLANFTKGKADELRKAMGKKKMDLIDKLRSEFIEGAKANGIEKALANDIYDTMAKFGEYGFNKSHSAAYTVLAYQTAWLKANYPPEYMAAVLGHNLNDLKKVTFYINECRRMGIAVLGPDVNESLLKFSVNKENQIRFGLAALKNVGESAAQSIIDERNTNGNYTEINDFFKRNNFRNVNKRALESLAMAGSFDNMNTHRAQFFHTDQDGVVFLEKMTKHASQMQEKLNSQQASLFGEMEEATFPAMEMPECLRWNLDDKLAKELDVAGFYISGHPLDEFVDEVTHFSTHQIQEISDGLDVMKVGTDLLFSGVVKDLQEKRDKNENMYSAFTLFDYSGEITLRAFKDDYIKYKSVLENGQKVFVHAKVDAGRFGRDPDSRELRLQSISKLAGYFDQKIAAVLFHVPMAEISAESTRRIDEILNAHAGNIAIRFLLMDPENKEVVKLSNPYLKTDIAGISLIADLEFVNGYDVRSIILSSEIPFRKKMTEVVVAEIPEEVNTDEYQE